MNKYQKAINVAYYIIYTGATLRDVEHHFKVPRSTAHNLVTKGLVDNPWLQSEVRKVLDYNKEQALVRATSARIRKCKERKLSNGEVS